jgi:RNA polymerase sigma-70 factor (ECF subfamily)
VTEDRSRTAGKILGAGKSGSGEPAEVPGLVRKARTGNTEAFDELVGLFQGRVWSVAWRMTGNRADAQEVSQEAFLRAYRYLGSFTEGRPFGPWITRITVHAANDHLRKTRPPVRLVSVDEEDSDRETPSSEPVEESRLLEEERRRVVFSLLDRLSERERAVFVLREMQGLPTSEVAGSLGIREVTVRRHVGRARARLLEIIRQEYPELLAATD